MKNQLNFLTRILGLSLLYCVLGSPAPTYSAPTSSPAPMPIIHVERVLGNQEIIALNQFPDDPSQIRTESPFRHLLNQDASILGHLDYKIDERKNVRIGKDSYKILNLNTDELNASYVVQDGYIKGYTLVDIYDITNHMASPFIQQIQALTPVDQNYLSGIPTKANLTLKFYSTQHDNYIETYLILFNAVTERNYLALDAYYPISLAQEMDARIKNHVSMLVNSSILADEFAP